MSRGTGALATAPLQALQGPAALAGAQRGRRARVEAPEPPEGGGQWYHLGPIRQATRAEVVGPDGPEDPEPGEPAEPVEEPAPEVDSTTADVYVYDSIGGWWGITADDFVRDVAGLDVERLVVHLNSPGGDAWDGVAIANMLRQHRAEVVVRVDGIAASAASVIAMAGDVVVMGLGSQMMVHDAWTMAVGNPADLRHEADVLDTLSNAIAETYVARAGGTVESWRVTMRAEGWYTASEAVAAGLADRVAGADDNATATGQQVVPGASSSSSWWWDAWDSLGAPERHSARLSAYRHAGRAEAPAPATPSREAGPATHRPPAASAPGSTPTPRGGSAVELTDEQVPQVRTQLGLPETADRAAVQAALDARLTGTPAAAAPQLPEGFVPIERSTLDALQASARRGDDARTEQEAQARTALVEAAIADGRIAPAARASWLAQLTPQGDGSVAASMATTLAQLPKGVIPTGGAAGYTGSAGGDRPTSTIEDVRNDPAYNAWKV